MERIRADTPAERAGCGRVKRRLQPLLALAQIRLRLKLFGNVRIRAEPARNLARAVADRQSTREEPAPLTVLAPQGKRIFPGLAGIQRLGKSSDNPIDKIGIMYALPAPALHVLKGCAGIVIPTLVIPEDPAGFVRHPSQLRNTIGKRPEQLLLLFQRLNSLLLSAEIYDNALKPNRLSGFVVL